MSKAIEGAAMLVGAVGMGVAAFLDPALVASPLFDKIWAGLILGGISMEAGAIADALMQNRGMGITTRQPAAFRQVIYGEQRVGGVEIYRSTTGGSHDQFNYIVVVAGHEIDSFVNLYLDGRQVYWQTGSGGNTTRNGVNFGGQADGNNHIGPNGQQYNFGTLVYCEARFGDQVDGDVIAALTANDPNWAASGGKSPWVGGCAYFYLKVEYDVAMFPGEPEIRVTVRGKNNILDPRTGTTGFTTNWALIVADVITDTVYGLGDNSVNADQLIAAANVCDEQIALAAGGTEAQFSLSWHYDTSTAPGDVLQTMMQGAAGRLSRIGGEWYIWPAYFQGASFTFDESALVDSLQWTEFKPLPDLFNRVNGTYIAPNFPYNVAGNLYDSNGYYNGETADNWPFAFQPTNFPQYAADVLHGYSSDAFLAQDGGVQLPKELTLSTVLSIAQAQRVAKINLMRNRQQGSGVFPMQLAAWQMQPTDVMQFTFAENGWTDKLLELDNTRFRIDAGSSGEDGGEPQAPRLYVEQTMIETDPSVYEWSTAEELTVYDVPSMPAQAPYTPASPTAMAINSGADTAVVGADGVTTPRALVSWTAPLDIRVTQVQLQYQAVGAASWTDAGTVDVGLFASYVTGVIAGAAYNFQIRSLRSSGAVSPWVQVLDYTISETLSTILSTGINPNSPWNVNNDATVDSIVDGSSAEIRVYGPGGVGTAWDNYTGQGNSTYPAAMMAGMAFATEYTVIFDTSTEEYSAMTDFNDTLSDSYIVLGTVLTVSSTGTGGGSGGGSGGAGPRLPGCTVEGEPLDTPDGPVDNRVLMARLEAGEEVWLLGRDGPERLRSAEWKEADRVFAVTVGSRPAFRASDSHPIKASHCYSPLGFARAGSLVETRDGFEPLQAEPVPGVHRVLHVHLGGPSHEYSVRGVFSHNEKISVDP
jgi:hypothetical protein